MVSVKKLLWPIMALLLVAAACKTSSPQLQEQKNWIWVHANDQKENQEWEADFEGYRKAGINAILIGANKKVLERVIPIAHKKDIEVHAWMWTLNRPGDSIALQHPEWYSVNRLGNSCFDKRPYVEYYQWVCPSIPQVQQHILNQVSSLLEIKDLDGIHLDYVRYCDAILPKGLWSKYGIVQDKVYPEWDFGYNPSNITLFKEQYGYSPLSLDDPSQDANWVKFRLNTVTTLVNRIADLVHSKNKILTAAVFPSPAMSAKMVYQAWDQWNLDAALPMIYHNFYEEDITWIGEIARENIQVLNGKFPMYPGLFVPDLKGEDLKRAMQEVAKSGAKGWALFDDHAFKTIHASEIKQ